MAWASAQAAETLSLALLAHHADHVRWVRLQRRIPPLLPDQCMNAIERDLSCRHTMQRALQALIRFRRYQDRLSLATALNGYGLTFFGRQPQDLAQADPGLGRTDGTCHHLPPSID